MNCLPYDKIFTIKFYFNKKANQLQYQSKCIYCFFFLFPCLFSMLDGYTSTWGNLTINFLPIKRTRKSQRAWWYIPIVLSVAPGRLGRRITWRPLESTYLYLKHFTHPAISPVLFLLFPKAQRAVHAYLGEMTILLQFNNIISFQYAHWKGNGLFLIKRKRKMRIQNMK